MQPVEQQKGEDADPTLPSTKPIPVEAVDQKKGEDASQTLTSSAPPPPSATTPLGEKKRVSARKSHTNYGAVPELEDPKVKAAFNEKLCEWGGVHRLLFESWVLLLPILILFSYIIHSNIATFTFVLECRTLTRESFERRACDITAPFCLFFPVIARLVGMWLVTWRLVRQRLWYVFLRRKILLKFDDSGWVVRTSVKGLLCLAGMAGIHLCLKIAYGCKRGKNNTITGEPMRVNTINEILNDLTLLNDPDNAAFAELLRRLFWEYILPAVLGMYLIYTIDDTESTLIPVSYLYDVNPWYTQRHLDDTIVVHEDVAREILQYDDEGDSESMISLRAAEIRRQNMSGACETFREEALTFNGVYAIGSEKDFQDAPLKSKRTTLPCQGLSDVLFKRWWPLEIILKDQNLVKGEPSQFRLGWVLHCFLIMIMLGDLFYNRCRGLAVFHRGLNKGTSWCSHSSVPFYLGNWAVVVTMLCCGIRCLWRQLRSSLSNDAISSSE